MHSPAHTRLAFGQQPPLLYMDAGMVSAGSPAAVQCAAPTLQCPDRKLTTNVTCVVPNKKVTTTRGRLKRSARAVRAQCNYLGV